LGFAPLTAEAGGLAVGGVILEGRVNLIDPAVHILGGGRSVDPFCQMGESPLDRNEAFFNFDRTHKPIPLRTTIPFFAIPVVFGNLGIPLGVAAGDETFVFAGLLCHGNLRSTATATATAA